MGEMALAPEEEQVGQEVFYFFLFAFRSSTVS